MRYAKLKVGLLVCVPILLSGQSVHAISADEMKLNRDPFKYVSVVQAPKKVAPKTSEVENTQEQNSETPTVAVQPVEYTVQEGDSLTKIGEKFNLEWTKLYDKNTVISSPDSISPGQVLTIPTPDEQLAKRIVPEAVLQPVSSESVKSGGAVTKSRYSAGSSAGNAYAPGYCTWYAKQRRPDLPNRMGNAISWVSSAAAQGFATGGIPRAGAIGQQGNHVVYIESVNNDGTVNVSEMNYRGVFVVSSRTVAASNFRYIY